MNVSRLDEDTSYPVLMQSGCSKKEEPDFQHTTVGLYRALWGLRAVHSGGGEANQRNHHHKAHSNGKTPAMSSQISSCSSYTALAQPQPSEDGQHTGLNCVCGPIMHDPASHCYCAIASVTSCI